MYIILKTIIKPIDFMVLEKPFVIDWIISNIDDPIKMPDIKHAIKRLKIGCQLNFDVLIIINIIEVSK